MRQRAVHLVNPDRWVENSMKDTTVTTTSSDISDQCSVSVSLKVELFHWRFHFNLFPTLATGRMPSDLPWNSWTKKSMVRTSKESQISSKARKTWKTDAENILKQAANTQIIKDQKNWENKTWNKYCKYWYDGLWVLLWVFIHEYIRMYNIYYRSEDLSGYDRFPPLDAEYWLLVGRRSERSITDLWRAQRLQLLDQPTTRWSQSSPSAVAFLCQLLFIKWNEVLASLFCEAGEVSIIPRFYRWQTEGVFHSIHVTIWSWQIWRAFCKGLDPTRNRQEVQLPGSRRMPSQSADSSSCQWGSKVSSNTSHIEAVSFWRHSTHRSWWRADYSHGTTGSQEATRAEYVWKGFIALHRKLGKDRKNPSMGKALGNRISRRCQIRTGLRVKRRSERSGTIADRRWPSNAAELRAAWSKSRGVVADVELVFKGDTQWTRTWNCCNSQCETVENGELYLKSLNTLMFSGPGHSHIFCSYFLAILHVVLRVQNSLRSSILGQEASCRDLLASWANMSLVNSLRLVGVWCWLVWYLFDNCFKHLFACFAIAFSSCLTDLLQL